MEEQPQVNPIMGYKKPQKSKPWGGIAVGILAVFIVGALIYFAVTSETKVGDDVTYTDIEDLSFVDEVMKGNLPLITIKRADGEIVKAMAFPHILTELQRLESERASQHTLLNATSADVNTLKKQIEDLENKFRSLNEPTD